jgi:hypothetical protein
LTESGSTSSAAPNSGDRLVTFAGGHQRDAEVVVDVDRRRDRLQRDPEVLDRVGRLALVDQRVREVICADTRRAAPAPCW